MGLLNSVLFANSVEKNFLPQEMILQVGKFYASFGKEQFVPIQGLVGDNFTITDGHDSNYFFGLGYFKELLHTDSMQVLVGLNGFYLAKTKVQGDVQQEQLFTNLSYHYYITQFPIYAAGKILFATPYDRCKVSFDMGLGPNIMVTSDFKETSLDGGETIPDKIFKGQTTAPFSATAGLGLRFNRVIGPVAVEIGYRFFYLGNGSLKNTNSEVVGDLDTGNSYANSFIVSLIA
jgi:hypothetical protein